MSSAPSTIPRPVVYRLTLYHRQLQVLRTNGVELVSSIDLAEAAGVKPAQLRRDLAHFGHFGTRGIGYSVSTLLRVFQEHFPRDQARSVILVGAGNLGRSLLRHTGFAKEGFRIVAAFDSAPTPPQDNNDLTTPILHDSLLEKFLQQNLIQLAILCVPPYLAQITAQRLSLAGIRGILNFSPARLELPKNVSVNNVDLAMELASLSYYVR